METVSDDTIYLEQMELGPMQNFVYLIGDPQARECVVVDPAWEIDTIVDTAQADGMMIKGALVTHTHQDQDRKSTRLNSSHSRASRMPSSA